MIIREILTALLEEFSRNQQVLSGTLKRMGEVTEKAVLLAGDSLAGIYKTTSQHVKDLDALKMEESDGSSNTAFSAVLAKFLSSVPVFLDAMVKQTQLQAGQAKRAREDVTNIRRFLDSISGISTACRLLATNARIEAAHAGENGKGFAVVADSLRNVSQDVQATALSIESLGSSIGAILVTMAETADQLAKEGNLRMEELSMTTGECQRAYSDAVIGALAKFGTRAEQIRDQANQTISHLQFQDRVQQNISEAIKQSEMTITLLQSLIKEVDGSSVAVDGPRFRRMMQDVRGSLTATSSVVIVPLEHREDDGEVSFL